ncbi:MAG: tRNA preQ1(34) S-adenosylmethionine ribosyltransferase-isomerase QueA [Desulfobulbaceae bacterium]|nr:MAG: tRNA preQ1(34) S-adenosylmethionine ribosyltransferase-isomerase QueA [Desulfobulbaceae bacterium]
MQDDLKRHSYDFNLPDECIAQHPSQRRDESRLLVYNRRTRSVTHLLFNEIVALFSRGDLLVVNDTKVFPARLQGVKQSGGKIEVFLLEYPAPVDQNQPGASAMYGTQALFKSSRKPKPGSTIHISPHCVCIPQREIGRGKWEILLEIDQDQPLQKVIEAAGDIPLPPYINRPTGTNEQDRARYQTVYARQFGAVAAPTAGLHFTPALLKTLENNSVSIAPITLHVGYGTFSPVEAEIITEHKIHREYYEISAESAKKIRQTKQSGGKIWAVGTTSTRTVEYAATKTPEFGPSSGWCDLYITPGYQFKIVDNLITNFHLPRSSLMFLVSALCGRESLLHCYDVAVNEGYRFFSYGDAMAIISE